MITIEFVAGLPKEAAIILRAYLSDAGYTPAPTLKIGLPSEPESVRAARLVLVEGLSGAAAGRQVGITRDAAAKAVQRCRKAMELARRVVANAVG